MTPRTAAKIREAAERRALEEAKAAGAKAGRKQIIDTNIQLAGVGQQNASPLTLIEVRAEKCRILARTDAHLCVCRSPTFLARVHTCGC